MALGCCSVGCDDGLRGGVPRDCWKREKLHLICIVSQNPLRSVAVGVAASKPDMPVGLDGGSNGSKSGKPKGVILGNRGPSALGGGLYRPKIIRPPSSSA
jgi:hypothetical protein